MRCPICSAKTPVLFQSLHFAVHWIQLRRAFGRCLSTVAMICGMRSIDRSRRRLCLLSVGRDVNNVVTFSFFFFFKSKNRNFPLILSCCRQQIKIICSLANSFTKGSSLKLAELAILMELAPKLYFDFSTTIQKTDRYKFKMGLPFLFTPQFSECGPNSPLLYQVVYIFL